MSMLFRYIIAAAFLAVLALPALADEKGEDLEKDARYAEGTPPMIPHRIEVNGTGEYCLGCHASGIKGAPITPHPVRLDCAQCHGQGEIIAKKAEKKKASASKVKHKD